MVTRSIGITASHIRIHPEVQVSNAGITYLPSGRKMDLPLYTTCATVVSSFLLAMEDVVPWTRWLLIIFPRRVLKSPQAMFLKELSWIAFSASLRSKTNYKWNSC